MPNYHILDMDAFYASVELLRYLQNRSLGAWVDAIVGHSSDAAVAREAQPFIYISVAATLLIFLSALTAAWASLRGGWVGSCDDLFK